MNLQSHLATALVFLTLITGALQNITAQVISSATVIPIDEPLTINTTIMGGSVKHVDIDVSIDGIYSNLSILCEGANILDNMDIPSTGAHSLNALVVLPETGNVELTIVATGTDITITYLDFTDVDDLPFPVYTEVTEEVGLIDDPSLKYGGPTIADMDNDGDYDLILNNHNDVTSKLFWNNGDNTFTRHSQDLAKWNRMDLHGTAAGDYDNDGDLDLVMSLGGGNGTSPQPPIFYKNENGSLVRSAAELGINSGARGRAARWSDLDLDGDLDLLLINAAGIDGNNESGAQHIFYTNNGDGSFTSVSIPGLENAPGASLLLTDLNNDYIDDIVMLSPLEIWKGNGDFTFTDMTDSWLPVEHRNKWGTITATDIDIDNDGDLDLYLASGQGYFTIADQNSVDFDPIAEKLDTRLSGSEGTTLFQLSAPDSILLYEFITSNRSTYDGDFPVFLGSSKTAILVESENDSLWVTPVMANGWPASRTENGLYIGHTGNGNWNVETVRNADIYWSIHLSIDGVNELATAWNPNNRNVQDLLLRNDMGSFVDVSTEWNIPKGGNHWGVTTGDFNNDTYQDLYIHRFGYLKKRLSDYMLLNTGEGSFEISTSHNANNAGHKSHGDMGQAFDFDLDGDVDILNGDDEYGVWHLYQNNKADDNNYAIVKVGYSPISNVDPISADIVLTTNTDTLHKRVGSAGEIFSQSLLNMVHFGLGEADSVKTITIRWRNGEVAYFNDKEVNQIFDTDKVDPENITIVPKTDSVRINSEIELEIDVEPSYANRNVWWHSLNALIASVDSLTGFVRGNIVDQTTKIVATSYANGLTDTATVKVVPWYAIPTDSVVVTPESATLTEGNTVSLTATVYPKYADEDSLVWSSSNTSIATVNDHGLVTTFTSGEVTIIASIETNNSIKDSCVLKVTRLEAPDIAIENKTFYTASAFVKGIDLEVTINYHAGTGKQIVASTWGGVRAWLRHIRVNDNGGWGIVRDIYASDASSVGQESGTSVIHITLDDDVIPSSNLPDNEFYYLFANFESNTGDGLNDNTYPIEVISADDISITLDDGSVQLRSSTQLIPNISPENLFDTSVTWLSNDEGIATVNSSGVITGVAPGTTTINATTNIGNASAIGTFTVTSESSINRLTGQEISIYPNPANHFISVNGLEDGLSYTIKIVNAIGEFCLVEEIQGIQTISLDGLVKGSYSVKVEGINYSRTFKLIKM